MADDNSTDRGDGTVAENADQEATAATGREQYQPTKLESFMAIAKTFILRGLIIYLVMAFLRRPQQQTEPGANAPPQALNIFENSSIMDMYVYLSEDEKFLKHDESKLIWQKNGLIYGDWTSGPNGDGTYNFETKFQASEKLRNNGSIYLHVFVVKRDKLTKTNEKFKLSGKYVSKATKQLNRFKKLKFVKTQNLLTGETTLTPEEIKKAETMKQEIVSHWHPNMTINLVTDFTPWVQGNIPPPLNEYFEFVGTGEHYKPPVYFNEFWNMMRDYQPINASTTELELKLTYQPLSLLRWQVYSAQSQSSRNKWASGIFQEETDDDDQDSIKEALLDTSPYLLGATVIVSILHSVFELLAFKNDIQFWNNRKSLEGLSVRMVFFNVFQSVVILLYVFDNDTNMIIRISCLFSLAIEVWKINKVIDISFDRENAIMGFIPKITFTDKGSYVESSTKEYDQLAFKYLSWALYPCLLGYAVYSLLYQEHKGWYSWVLNMLYGFMLTFGFIMMTPQLFINYKLKSVAHLPWRMLSYKFLNTFIDDIFAFVIKMPTMYRLGCFRDDIIFFIFLYQRWIYKTDLTRVNEFGYSGDMEGDAPQQTAGEQPAVANGQPKAIMDKKKD
ncbi:hypothetical protein LSTR_LSTR005033 [Laodelphax striatellus]|uniref:Uncharacterized protein n=1 Tax=Laodelphax striatellus TaxID=195883 RepID=A0A482WUL2_LAOST|nr:hypothetical protein LSTR_LSTR005033 [Laodelphax striatellus]